MSSKKKPTKKPVRRKRPPSGALPGEPLAAAPPFQEPAVACDVHLPQTPTAHLDESVHVFVNGFAVDLLVAKLIFERLTDQHQGFAGNNGLMSPEFLVDAAAALHEHITTVCNDINAQVNLAIDEMNVHLCEQPGDGHVPPIVVPPVTPTQAYLAFLESAEKFDELKKKHPSLQNLLTGIEG